MIKTYGKLRKWLHRSIYSFLIYKTIVLDKQSVRSYAKSSVFCTIDVNTDKGVFKFIFKRDRRIKRRNENMFPNITNYIVELEIPENLIPYDETIKNKIVVVVKIALFKPDYNVLTELLVDIYLDRILKYIVKRDAFIKASAGDR